MFYNVLFSQDYQVYGFISDMDEMPVSYATEKEALEAKKGHMAEQYIKTLEIEW